MGIVRDMKIRAAASKVLRRGNWGIKRKKPYTETGIERLSCIRCGKPAKYQWQICSDGNNYRPICAGCDVALNQLVLEFMNHPKADELSDKYKREKENG